MIDSAIFHPQINAGNKALYYEGSMQSLPRGVGGGYVERMKGGLKELI